MEKWNRGNTAGMEGFEVEWCGKLLFHVERLEAPETNA
jgi:hypothetical protein